MLDYSPLECKQENNQLICQIKKLEIEKSLFGNQDTRSVYYKSDLDNHGHARLPLVGDIIIIDNIIKEKDVFVGITKLIENVAEGHSTLAYETNVTNIDKIIGKISLDFEYENQYSFPMNCVLRKYDNYPLYIVCVDGKSSKMHLKEITKEIIHKTAHIKYNFRIQPVKNEDIIYYSKEDKGSYILWPYPETLDFTRKDTLYVEYSAENEKESYLKGMTFNQDKGDLSCEIGQNGLLRCIVPKSHFDKNEFYFIKHNNHLNKKSTIYEIAPIKVILNEKGKRRFYSLSLYYLLLLILIMF